MSTNTKKSGAVIIDNIDWEKVSGVIEANELHTAESISSLIKKPDDYLTRKIQTEGALEEGDFNLMMSLLQVRPDEWESFLIAEPEPEPEPEEDPAAEEGPLSPLEEKICSDVKLILAEIKGIRQAVETYLNTEAKSPTDMAKDILNNLLEANNGRVKEPDFNAALADAGIGSSYANQAILACNCRRNKYLKAAWIERIRE